MMNLIWELPLHRWALDKQSFHRGRRNLVECRPPLGALPPSPKVGVLSFVFPLSPTEKVLRMFGVGEVATPSNTRQSKYHSDAP